MATWDDLWYCADSLISELQYSVNRNQSASLSAVGQSSVSYFALLMKHWLNGRLTWSVAGDQSCAVPGVNARRGLTPRARRSDASPARRLTSAGPFFLPNLRHSAHPRRAISVKRHPRRAQNASPSGARECWSRSPLPVVCSIGGDGAPGGGHNDHLRRPAAGVHDEALLRHVPDEARRDPLLPRHPPLRHGLLRPGAQ
ncbi:hypothetical protein BS78_01G113100 [Paspalum vaginatum]|nr:hypothetical protein BS78_01G113100 [Paspalum vaginatum]